MKRVIGIDIGNSSTEVALVEIDNHQQVRFLESAIAETTGIKGTKKNLFGIYKAINEACTKNHLKIEEIDLIRINEATPVIGDVAMETITETIITESTMIGHNPKTPGGLGLGVGTTLRFEELEKSGKRDTPYILIIEKSFDFDDVARQINQFVASGYLITAAIMQSDDGVLVNNRLDKKYRLSMKFRISIKFLSICWQQLRWLRQVGVFLNCQIRMELPLSLILIQRQLKISSQLPGP